MVFTEHSRGAPAARRRRLPDGFPDPRGPARGRRDRFHRPAAALHQRRGARRELRHAPARRLHRGEVAGLRRLLAPFTRIAEILRLHAKGRNILDAYLGRSAGEKVLAGQIKRGDGEEISAVIWFCDLRDSTPLADSMSRARVPRAAQRLLRMRARPGARAAGARCCASSATRRSPSSRSASDPAEACARRWPRRAKRSCAWTSQRQSAAARCASASACTWATCSTATSARPTRIEFTVIGAAANEAARIEALCKELKAALLLGAGGGARSGAAARSARTGCAASARPVELFTLKLDARR